MNAENPGMTRARAGRRTIGKTVGALVGLAVSPVQAQLPVEGEFYGRINLSVQTEEFENGDSASDLVSNNSRIGFGGESALNEELAVIYQLEYQVNPDDGDHGGRTFTQRNSYLGLEGRYGTLLAGRHDTPLKMTQNGIDLFNDLSGDIGHVFSGENRLSDMLLYTSPDVSGFSASVAAIAGGDDGVREDFTDAVSLSLGYEQDALYVGLGLDRDVSRRDTLRLVSRYESGDLMLGAMYQKSELNDPLGSAVSTGDSQDGYFVSAAWAMDPITWKMQYGESDQRMEGGSQLSAGADYRLGDNTKAFVFYTATDADSEALKRDEFGLGLEHRF